MPPPRTYALTPARDGDLPGKPEAPVTASVVYRAVVLAFVLFVLTQIFPAVVGLVLLVLLVAIIAVPLSRAATRLERLGVPRPIGALVTLLAALAVLGGLLALLVPTIVAEGRHFVSSLPGIVDSLRRDLGNAGATSSPSRLGNDVQNYVNDYTSHPQKLLGPLTEIGTSVSSAAFGVIAVLLTALFAAINPGPLVDGAVRLVMPSRRTQARRVLHRLALAYVGWLKGLGAGMLVLGVLVYVGLQLVGLRYALVFATLTAVAMVIPYFGALASAIPPILYALTISPGKALVVALIYLATHQAEGNVVEPLIMARAVHLHPALIAVGILAVERLFGFVGLMIAVPIIVTLKIVIEEVWVLPMELAHRQAQRFKGDGTRGRSERREHEPVA